MDNYPVISNDRDSILTLKINYYSAKGDQTELFEKYRKHILLNAYYEQIKDYSVSEIDSFIQQHKDDNKLLWNNFLMYIDLSYTDKEIDEEIIERMKKYNLSHYSQCYMMVQCYDNKFYNYMLTILPKKYHVIPKLMVLIVGKGEGLNRLSHIENYLEEMLTASLEELNKRYFPNSFEMAKHYYEL